jgi:hypothetical protein
MVSSRKRGIRHRLITEIDESNAKLAERVVGHFESRRSRDILSYMVIVDRSEMELGPAFHVSEEEAKSLNERQLDLWTSSPRFYEACALCSRDSDACGLNGILRT